MGISQNVKLSCLAMPIVAVLRRDGTVFLCWDLEVTSNLNQSSMDSISSAGACPCTFIQFGINMTSSYLNMN